MYFKKITSVRMAKKFLKDEMDVLHPTRKRYSWIKWDKKKTSFLVDTIHGQRIRIFEICITKEKKYKINL